MTEFPRDNEQEQYIDFLLDRVEWLEQELEESEREKLALKQGLSTGPSTDTSEKVEEQLPKFLNSIADKIREIHGRDLEVYALTAKAEMLLLEKQFQEEHGEFPSELQKKSGLVHQELDRLIRRCLRNAGANP